MALLGQRDPQTAIVGHGTIRHEVDAVVATASGEALEASSLRIRQPWVGPVANVGAESMGVGHIDLHAVDGEVLWVCRGVHWGAEYDGVRVSEWLLCREDVPVRLGGVPDDGVSDDHSAMRPRRGLSGGERGPQQ